MCVQSDGQQINSLWFGLFLSLKPAFSLKPASCVCLCDSQQLEVQHLSLTASKYIKGSKVTQFCGLLQTQNINLGGKKKQNANHF